MRRTFVAMLLTLLACSASAATLQYVSRTDARKSLYTLKRDGERLVIVDDATGTVLASSLASETRRVDIRGADGDHDDTLTVDFSGGLSLPEGVDFDGGAGGWDTLNVVGANSKLVSRPTNAMDGVITVGDVELRYRNLEPITIAVPVAAPIFFGTPGSDLIVFGDGPAGFASVSSSNGTFESTDFATSGQPDVTIDGFGGGDSFTVNALTVTPRPNSLTLQNVDPANNASFVIVPDDSMPITINGQQFDSAFVNLTGVTSPVTQGSPALGNFVWHFGNRADVRITNVSNVNPSDLSITATAPLNVTPGLTVTYSVTVANGGGFGAGDVTWSDVLPSEMTFASLVQNSGPAATCTTPAANAPGTVSCFWPTLGSFKTATFTLVVNLLSSAQTTHNTLTVSSVTTDTDTSNNSVEPLLNLQPVADLRVTFYSGPPAWTSPGRTVTYDYFIANYGPSDAIGVSFHQLFTQPGATQVSFAVLSQPNASPSFSALGNPGGTGSTDAFSSALVANDAMVFEVVEAVADDFTPATLDQTVQVSSSTTPDADTSNNIMAPSTLVDHSADMAISVTSSPSSVVPGSATPIVYTVTLTNQGPSSASGAGYTLVTPPGTHATSIGFVGGITPTTSLPVGGTGIVSVTFPQPYFHTNESSTTQVVLTVDANTTASPLAATFVAAATNGDGTLINNSATVNTTITPQADVAVTLSAPATASAGTYLVYTLTVANNGLSDAANVSVSLPLPSGPAFGGTVQATGPAFTTGFAANVVTASIATLAAGASASFTITTTIPALTVNGTVLSATATGSTTTADTSAGNNTGNASTTVSNLALFSGPSLGPIGGTITAFFTGGGGTCAFSSPQFIGSPPGAPPVPSTLPVPSAYFPFGMFDFSLTGCAVGSTVTLTMTYPAAVPAGTRYWKYGPTAADHNPHWYVMPSTIAGNTVTFSITDGGLGDDDLTANGVIDDQGGPGVGGDTIPTLSNAMLLLISLLVLGGAAIAARRKATQRS